MKLLRGTLDNERLQVQGSNDLLRGGNRSRGMTYVVIEDVDVDHSADDDEYNDDDEYDDDVVVVVVVDYTHLLNIYSFIPSYIYRNSSPYPSNSCIRRWNGCDIEDRT